MTTIIERAQQEAKRLFPGAWTHAAMRDAVVLGATFAATITPEQIEAGAAAAARAALDAALDVDELARVLSTHWRDMHTNESLGQQLMLADAIRAHLLGQEG